MADKLSRIDLPEGHTVDNKYLIRKRLGEGGAGVVYEVEQLGLNVIRALKFLDPIKPDLDEEFEKTFVDEVKHLAQLTHANIIKIIDYHPWSKDDSAKPPYFVMEFANGGELSNAFSRIQSRADLLNLLDQMFYALEYIHYRGMMHGDIKPNNILCHDPGGAVGIEVKIGDLGVSKLLGMAQIGETARGDTTHVWGTRNYAAPEIREKINTLVSVDNNWLEEHRATLDLYSLGATMAELLSEATLNSEANRERIDELLTHLKPSVMACLTVTDQLYLKRLVRKLTERELENRYQTIQEARMALRRVIPRQMAYGAISELTGIGCTRNIYHGSRQVWLSEQTFRWINHPTVQRLNNLNQLNLLFNIYPGARHSRFSHSLEAFETAREVTLHLLNDDSFRFLLDEHDISLFLAASLLHDIGHYPLAHALEDLRPKFLSSDPLDLSAVRADYELIPYFLRASYEDALPPWNKPLWDMLSDDGIDPERLVRLVSKHSTTTDAESVMQTLLDGAFDIDKIAYLRHDSQATTVPYGNGIDLEGLFHALIVLLPSEYPQVRNAQIGLLSRGVSPVESVIVARYHMYSRVYWHRTNRAIMAMLGYAVHHLIGGNNPLITFKQYIQETRNLSDKEAVSWLSQQMQNGIEQQAFQSISRRPIRNFLPGITDGTRRFYKRLITFVGHTAEPELGNCQQFLLSLGSEDIEQIRIDVQNLIAKYVACDSMGDEEVLLDVPQSHKELEAMPSELYVVDEQTRRIHPFSDYSRIAVATREQYKSLAHRSRIFVSPQLAELCRPHVGELRKRITSHIVQHMRRG